jgi:hypothetical protein
MILCSGLLLLVLESYTSFAAAQEVLSAQSNTFNSSFNYYDALLQNILPNITLENTTANNLNIALNFERGNWASLDVRSDAFYSAPSNISHLPPGSLLKVEEYTNTSFYVLPPNTGLSRFLYQTETINGSAVPNSAYVLWPWMPRVDPATGKWPVVGWAHRTSGVYANCAPSHVRDLWYQYWVFRCLLTWRGDKLIKILGTLHVSPCKATW